VHDPTDRVSVIDPARTIDSRALAGETPATFMDLRPGTYAVAAFHDENASGEFDGATVIVTGGTKTNVELSY
jgi:uncharacterized protein (DUF2141 family)